MKIMLARATGPEGSKVKENGQDQYSVIARPVSMRSNYYERQLQKQYPDDRDKKYRNACMLDLKTLVNDRF
jgi:hypothetical protein